MPQQIADLTLAEVEDFVAAMAPVLAPIFGAVGACRYPTKPLAAAVQVHMVSFSPYLRGRPSLAYPRVIHAVLSGEVPHGYTTIKSERELEENLMGLLRAHQESIPSTSRTWPGELVLRTSQFGRSPHQIPAESGIHTEGDPRQH